MYPVSKPLTSSDISFSYIVATLRCANARYQRVARAMRNNIQPTSRARHRAQKLQLGVDIEKAVNCPQHAVSILPLPLLETSVNHLLSSSTTPEELVRTLSAIGVAGAPSTSNNLRILSTLLLAPFSGSSYRIYAGTHPPSPVLSSVFSTSPVTSVPAIAQDERGSSGCQDAFTALTGSVHRHASLIAAPTEDGELWNPDRLWSPASSPSCEQLPVTEKNILTAKYARVALFFISISENIRSDIKFRTLNHCSRMETSSCLQRLPVDTIALPAKRKSVEVYNDITRSPIVTSLYISLIDNLTSFSVSTGEALGSAALRRARNGTRSYSLECGLNVQVHFQVCNQ
jgi:hypothetical protein